MQVKMGTVSVTQGSSTVTGTDTLWAANVTPGDGFTVAGTGVPYTVASVTNDTSLELSTPYAGATASGQSYAIYRDFTTNESLPELSQGDIETATIWTRALRKIDARLGAATTTSRGTVEKATTAEAEAGTADKYPDAAGVHAAFGQYGLGADSPVQITDLNTAFTAGLYKFLSSATGSPFSNNSGTLEVIPFFTVASGSNNNAVRQVARMQDASKDTSVVVERNIWGDPSQIGPWREVYNQDSILGPVSKTGDYDRDVNGNIIGLGNLVPTGAIIETGSNSNGTYTRFADGTMWCSHVLTAPYSNSFAIVATWNLPAGFSTTSFWGTVTAADKTSSGFTISARGKGNAVFDAETATTATVGFISNGTFASDESAIINVIAKGRWF